MRLTTRRLTIAILIAGSIVAACSSAASPPAGASAPTAVRQSAAPPTAESSAMGPSTPASLAPGASPPASMLDTAWKLTSITETTPPFQAVIPVADETKYTIEFHPDGTFMVVADCNQFGVAYAVYRGDGQNNFPLEPGGGSISFLPRPSGLVNCPAGSLADRFVSALSNTSSVEIDGDQLTLTLTDQSKLQFSR